MSPLNALVFGLGLFFLGLRLVGENLQGLCSGGFRSAIAATASRPLAQAALGAIAGALMQSATAVTFICVSLVSAGLLAAAAAGPVILWSNVGLTALAFVATLNIHPLVAYLIGGSGIVLGVVRLRTWRTAASVLLGIGLILFGLEQMGAGAAPLKDAAWFQSAMHGALASPLTSFAAGVLVAAILQSNTGATMMVIALAGAGAIPFEKAALLIYGTNLGAIALRLLLAAGMRGESLRLVRLEDLFCVVSGILMLGLYAIEQAGVPLVFALASSLSSSLSTRLATLFFLSNLIPALAMTPVLGLCRTLLVKVWPGEGAEADGRPKFITPQALGDPTTALDLLRRELARLALLAGRHEPALKPTPDVEQVPADFANLSLAIEDFAAQLASRSTPAVAQATRLHNLRAVLSGIRHAEEALRSFFTRLALAPDALPAEPGKALSDFLDAAMADIAHAIDSADASLASSVEARTHRHGPDVDSLRKNAFPSRSGPADPISRDALHEDFSISLWTLHRLAKLAARSQATKAS